MDCFDAPTGNFLTPYCPWCGAEMQENFIEIEEATNDENKKLDLMYEAVDIRLFDILEKAEEQHNTELAKRILEQQREIHKKYPFRSTKARIAIERFIDEIEKEI